jgi:hypothetical protein
MMRGMTNEQRLARAAELLTLQTAKIRELEAEIDRLHNVIAGSCDALMHLQRIYTDPKLPTSVTLKAAGAAVPYERAKPASVSINAGVSLYDVLERKRLEALQAKQTKVIDAKPDPAA